MLLILTALLSLMLFGGCAEKPLSPGKTPDLAYTLSLNAMHPESVFVSIAISETYRGAEFILPFIYADNPIDSFSGFLVNDISLTDSTGIPAECPVYYVKNGPVNPGALEIHDNISFPVTMSYRIDVNAVNSNTSYGGPPLVFMDSEAAFLQGNYLFAVPYFEDLTDLWRTAFNASLTIENKSGRNMLGAVAQSAYSNAYELLFLQVILGAEIFASGSGKGQEFVICGFPSAEHSGSSMNHAAAQDFSEILEALVPVFGKSGAEQYTVLFHSIPGGLEGTNSFTCRYPHIDTDSTLPMVFAHEFIHEFLGIRCGEFDDPWWKEGCTNYLGYEVASRLDLISKDVLKNNFVRFLELNDEEKGIAPSDPYVRENLYFKKLYGIVYNKGGMISMLIDEKLRRATGNQVGLEAAAAALCRKYRAGAFTRNEMLEHFTGYGGCDISAILEAYADKPDSIKVQVLASSYDYLDSCGVFGDGIGRSSGKRAVIIPGKAVFPY
jgi:predicted metalloprotease with PDZ domain